MTEHDEAPIAPAEPASPDPAAGPGVPSGSVTAPHTSMGASEGVSGGALAAPGDGARVPGGVSGEALGAPGDGAGVVAPAVLASPKGEGIFSWVREALGRRRALADADAAWASLTSEEQRRLERARALTEAAARLTSPIEPLPGGLSGAYPAHHLLREARALLSLPEGPTDEATVMDDLRVVSDEVARRLEPLRRRGDLLVSRWLRLGLVAAGGALVLLGLLALGQRLATGPNLAASAKWKASSSLIVCHPEKMDCGGTRTAIFFHTAEEDSPWIEYDLGSAKRISRVFVRNREDFGRERAVPLVVELSTDRKKWVEVGKMSEPFDTWTAQFASTDARYVRLRVTKRTYLHLETVEIR